jgi:hypothetical protein
VDADEDVELFLRVHFRPPNQRIESAKEDPAKRERVGLRAGIHSGIAGLSQKGSAGNATRAALGDRALRFQCVLYPASRALAVTVRG